MNITKIIWLHNRYDLIWYWFDPRHKCSKILNKELFPLLKRHKLDFYLLRKTKRTNCINHREKVYGFVFIRFCTMEPTPNCTRLNTWSFAGLQRSGTAKCRGLARYPFSAPFPFYELSSVLQILLFLLLDQWHGHVSECPEVGRGSVQM